MHAPYTDIHMYIYYTYLLTFMALDVHTTYITFVGMVSSGFGHIVNISSTAGKMGAPLRSSYSATKFAILGLMESIRVEVKMLF